jgi:hypothetical protein
VIGVRTDFDPEEPVGEADDEAVSAVVLKPTRTAGELCEAAGGSAEITLEELLRRVRRIEEHLGIGTPKEAEAFEYLDKPSGEPHSRAGKQHPTVRSPGREESGRTGTPSTLV